MQITSYGAFVADLPGIVKAVTTPGGQRMLRINSSVEQVDSEGDCILMNALLAEASIRSGHLHLDHLSEIGERLGIARPLDYIVGVPKSVFAASGKRTMVDGLILKNRTKADELWDAIKAGIPFSASIYGFPTADTWIDVRQTPGHPMVKATGATRFSIPFLLWRSLAITKHPICTGVKPAEVIQDRAPIMRPAA